MISFIICAACVCLYLVFMTGLARFISWATYRKLVKEHGEHDANEIWRRWCGM